MYRYPDKKNVDLKNKLSSSLGLFPDNIIVGNGSDEIMMLIEERRESQKIIEEQEKIKIKEESKDFRGKVGELIKIKEELIHELGEKEEEEEKFKEKLQKAKEREEVDNLKRMNKEAGEKKKK